MKTYGHKLFQYFRNYSILSGKRDISREAWTRVRTGSTAYPLASFSLMKGSLKGLEVIGWVNMGYKEYKYKQFCPYYLQIEVDMSDRSLPQFDAVDLEIIEEFFLDGLQKLCVSHMVTRMLAGHDVLISMYVEDREVVGHFLDNALKAENRPFNFDYSFEEDARWKEVSDIFNK